MTDGDLLVALLGHDLAIARADRALDELPEKQAILQVRKRLREIEEVRGKAEAYCRRAEALVAKATDESTMVRAKIDAEQEKVLSGSVTNPKELQNLTRELDSLKRRVDALDQETIGFMEKAEAGEAQLTKVDAALAEGRQKESGLIERFRAKGGELQTEISRLHAERDLLVAALPEELRRRYERLREAKKGIAVGVLADGMCGACRTHLPTDRAQAIESGPEIAECPNCRRILIVGRPS